MTRARWALAGAAVVILAGVALRVFVLTHALGVLDADEATTGLVARHFLHNHEHPVFYWASNYGGTVEAMVTAAAFALFGSSVLVLKVVAIVWHAAACVLVWRVGIRLVSRRVGAVAGLLLWVWPGTYVWWSTKSRGFYGALLVCALVMALCALRLAENPRRWLDWAALGFALGVGWWTGPQIAVIAIPIGVWLLVQNWRAALYGWAAVPFAMLGALPWLAWNLRHHFASFDVPPQPVSAPYLTRLGGFWSEGLPMATGLRVPYTKAWIEPFASALFPVLVVVVAVVLAVRYRRVGLVLIASVVLYALAYALSPLTVGSSDGRYVFLLSPVLALALAACVTWRRWVVEAAALAVAVALSALGLSAMHNGNSFAASDRIVPVDIKPLIRDLEANGPRTVVADYGIAYRLDFESHERIVAAGAPYNRYDPYLARLADGPPPAWVFVAGSTADSHFRAAMDAAGEHYALRRVGAFAVYVPEHRFLPGQMPSF